MNQNASQTSIFQYTDYRKFLVDFIAREKAEKNGFSQKVLAEKAGIKSPGFITQIIQGKSNLPDRLIGIFAESLQLKKREANYFELMVHYNQAENHEIKKSFFKKMTVYKKGNQYTLTPDEFLFYDKWYYSAIRAVLQYLNFKDDYSLLASSIVPSIKPSEAKKAISVLEQLGLIQKNNEGQFVLTEKHVTTGLNSDSVIINNFVVNTLEIAKDALYRFPKDQRRLSSLTLGVSETGYLRLRDRIDEFRQELIQIVKEDHNIDRVYQVNFQIFPLTSQQKEKQ